MLTLYDYELSAACYQVRLMLGVLRLEYRTVPVDIYPGDDNKSPSFRALNPFGEVPVLVDGGSTLFQSNAILAYLAKRYDPNGKWLPSSDPAQIAAIFAWQDVATRMLSSAGLARDIMAMSLTLDVEAARTEAHRLLRGVDEHLWFAETAGQIWVATTEHPSIADIALFPALALCEEGGVSRQDYPAIRRWLDRVRQIEGFTIMSGIFPASPPHPNGPLAWKASN